jgi:hypothetical protein
MGVVCSLDETITAEISVASLRNLRSGAKFKSGIFAGNAIC